MPTAKVTSKGQVTLPLDVRRRMGIERGDEIEFREENGRFVLVKRLRHTPFDAYVGFLKDKQGVDPDELVAELRGEGLAE